MHEIMPCTRKIRTKTNTTMRLRSFNYSDSFEKLFNSLEQGKKNLNYVSEESLCKQSGSSDGMKESSSSSNKESIDNLSGRSLEYTFQLFKSPMKKKQTNNSVHMRKILTRSKVIKSKSRVKRPRKAKMKVKPQVLVKQKEHQNHSKGTSYIADATIPKNAISTPVRIDHKFFEQSLALTPMTPNEIDILDDVPTPSIVGSRGNNLLGNFTSEKMGKVVVPIKSVEDNFDFLSEQMHKCLSIKQSVEDSLSFPTSDGDKKITFSCDSPNSKVVNLNLHTTNELITESEAGKMCSNASSVIDDCDRKSPLNTSQISTSDIPCSIRQAESLKPGLINILNREASLFPIGRKGSRYSCFPMSSPQMGCKASDKNRALSLRGGKGWKRSIIPSIDPLREENQSLRAFPRRQTELAIFEEEVQTSEPNCQVESLDQTKTSIPLTQLTLLDKVLSLCNQQEIIQFDDWCHDRVTSAWKKIGEGVFGEVFVEPSVSGSHVFKIVPVDGSTPINDDQQTELKDIYSEMMLTKSLSDLRTRAGTSCDFFVQVYNFVYVNGSYPARLLELWEEFDLQKGSENECPDKLPSDQTYIIFELAHAGTDLEKYTFESSPQALSIFYQVSCALAVAEEAVQFEHRDLHWGNVLIAPIDEESIAVTVNNRHIRIPSHGVKCTIIDYSLSRMRTKHCVIYQKLTGNPWLFEGKGDIQFDVYRDMKKHNGDDWEAFNPYTNILWLQYLISKISSSSTFKSKGRDHGSVLRKLRSFKKDILKRPSALELVQTLPVW